MHLSHLLIYWLLAFAPAPDQDTLPAVPTSPAPNYYWGPYFPDFTSLTLVPAREVAVIRRYGIKWSEHWSDGTLFTRHYNVSGQPDSLIGYLRRGRRWRRNGVVQYAYDDQWRLTQVNDFSSIYDLQSNYTYSPEGLLSHALVKSIPKHPRYADWIPRSVEYKLLHASSSTLTYLEINSTDQDTLLMDRQYRFLRAANRTYIDSAAYFPGLDSTETVLYYHRVRAKGETWLFRKETYLKGRLQLRTNYAETRNGMPVTDSTVIDFKENLLTGNVVISNSRQQSGAGHSKTYLDKYGLPIGTHAAGQQKMQVFARYHESDDKVQYDKAKVADGPLGE